MLHMNFDQSNIASPVEVFPPLLPIVLLYLSGAATGLVRPLYTAFASFCSRNLDTHLRRNMSTWLDSLLPSPRCVYFLPLLLFELWVPTAPSTSVVVCWWLCILSYIVMGISELHGCVARYKKEEEKLADAVAAVEVANQHLEIVHSLIPESVLSKMTYESDINKFMGAEIADCSILFCALSPQEVLHNNEPLDLFSMLDEIFRRFDEVVEKHGMYSC